MCGAINPPPLFVFRAWSLRTATTCDLCVQNNTEFRCKHRICTQAWISRGRLRLKCDGPRAETRFLLSAKQTSPFKSAGASVQSTTGSWDVRISGSNAGYTMFRGSVESTGYPLHSPVFPSLPLPCVTVCHHAPTILLNHLITGTEYNSDHDNGFNIWCRLINMVSFLLLPKYTRYFPSFPITFLITLDITKWLDGTENVKRRYAV
jgi:hypothetical protein